MHKNRILKNWQVWDLVRHKIIYFKQVSKLLKRVQEIQFRKLHYLELEVNFNTQKIRRIKIWILAEVVHKRNLQNKIKVLNLLII